MNAEEAAKYGLISRVVTRRNELPIHEKETKAQPKASGAKKSAGKAQAKNAPSGRVSKTPAKKKPDK
jgi:enoyl-CoA hydratase/carnithine racemase